MGFTAGQSVTLSNTALYVSSDATTKSGTKTGTYYIWSASVINGRIRITSKKSYVGKTPAGTYVTGWVNTSDIGSSSSSGSTTTTGSASTAATASAAASTVATEKKTETQVEPTTTLPGQVGYLGMVVFLVTTEQIKTIDSFTWNHSANYAEHDRHLGRASLEFTGTNADEISLSFLLSAHMGTAPMTDYITLLGYMRNGTPVPLKIGSKVYGWYRWVITSLKYTGQYADKDGDWTQAKVDVSLKSYEKSL